MLTYNSYDPKSCCIILLCACVYRMDIHKMNSEYPKTFLKSRKQFGYCI